jgi:hypothetical protein
MAGWHRRLLYREPFIMDDLRQTNTYNHHTIRKIKQDRQCTYNAAPRHVRVTIVAVEKQ